MRHARLLFFSLLICWNQTIVYVCARECAPKKNMAKYSRRIEISKSYFFLSKTNKSHSLYSGTFWLLRLLTRHVSNRRERNEEKKYENNNFIDRDWVDVLFQVSKIHTFQCWTVWLNRPNEWVEWLQWNKTLWIISIQRHLLVCVCAVCDVVSTAFSFIS